MEDGHLNTHSNLVSIGIFKYYAEVGDNLCLIRLKESGEVLICDDAHFIGTKIVSLISATLQS